MAVALFFVFMLFLFIIGLPIVTISLIFLIKNVERIKKKKQYNKIIFGSTILGTIIGICLILIPIIYFIILRTANIMDSNENIKTNITTTWKTKEDYSGDYFILNNRRYEFLNIKNAQNSESIEIDRSIANIVPPNYILTKWFFLLFGRDIKETLYSLKNCDDYSILTTGGDSGIYFSLYCDKEYLENKKIIIIIWKIIHFIFHWINMVMKN